MFNILSYCSGGVRLAFLLLVFVALAVPGIEQSVCGQNRIADSKVKQDDPDRQRTLAALYKVKPGIQSSQKRAAELLFEFSSSARTEADCAKFFDQLGKIPAGPDGLKGMQVLIQTKTLIEQASINNKGISSLCLGSKLAGGGTEVERVLLSYRRNVVNQAIAQVAREFAGKSGNAEVFLAEIGKWASQSPNNFTFAGDIDFSFVSADKNLSWQMKQRFDQIIQMKTGLTPVQFDTVCTAHGRATPDVYILEHGELYGNSEMKKGSLKKIDLGSGTVSSETVPGEKVLADITRQLSTNPDFGEVKNFKSGQTEPGISMEMARHLENDIIKPKIFDPVDSIIKASKYVERSVASSKVNGGDLADFAAAMTRAAKTSDFATMAKLLRQKFPGMKLIIDTRGAKPTARIEMSHESVKNYFDECSKLIWNNAKTRLEDSINKLKYKLSSAQASELTKLRAEAKALKEMLATQIMVCKHDNVAVPPEIDLLSKRLDVIVDSFTDKHGLKKITAEEMQQKKFIEECIKAKTPTMRAIAIAYICKIGSAVNYVALEAPNTILDYIDQRLLGELRGENSDFDEYMRQLFEIKKNLSEGTKPRPTTIQNLQSKAASVIRSCNTSMNKVLSATATRRAGLKVMQAVNLYNELEAYYQGYNSDGFYGVSTEFFRRRIPLGAATDAFVQENYLRVGIELVYTIFPPVAIPEGLYGMAVQAHGWGVRRLDSWNYKATVDELYAGCEFAKVGTGKGWRLVSLKYAGRKYGSRDEALLLPLKNRSVWRVLSQELRQFPALKAFEEILDRSDISSGHSGEWPYRYEGLSKYGSQLQTLYLQEADKVVLEYFEGVIEELERRKGLSTGTG